MELSILDSHDCYNISKQPLAYFCVVWSARYYNDRVSIFNICLSLKGRATREIIFGLPTNKC